MSEQPDVQGRVEFRIDSETGTGTLEEAWARELLLLAEKKLAAADGMIRLAVSRSTISAIKQENDWLEIIVQSERDIKITTFEYTVSYRRLFIPLSGEYADGVTTFFYGADQYRSGPLRLSFSPDAIADLVRRRQERD